jgi:hypothetical protein
VVNIFAEVAQSHRVAGKDLASRELPPPAFRDACPLDPGVKVIIVPTAEYLAKGWFEALIRGWHHQEYAVGYLALAHRGDLASVVQPPVYNLPVVETKPNGMTRVMGSLRVARTSTRWVVPPQEPATEPLRAVRRLAEPAVRALEAPPGRWRRLFRSRGRKGAAHALPPWDTNPDLDVSRLLEPPGT